MAHDLYHDDYYAWTVEQAERLRSRAGSDNALDYENLAEEVDDLGRSVRRACTSQMMNIIEHLLKIELVGGLAVAHWRSEITDFRIELETDLTPSLRAALPSELEQIYGRTRRRMTARLASQEIQITLPEQCPYTWDDLVGRGVDWFPAPLALSA